MIQRRSIIFTSTFNRVSFAKHFFLSAFLLSLTACGDSRPDAAGAAHVFNSTEGPVQARVEAENGNGVDFPVAPGEGVYVPLSKADTYVVTVTDPADLSYREEVVVPAGDKTDTVFDIGSAASFILTPTYHVPSDMTELAAQGLVEKMKQAGDHRDYILDVPAPVHTLPRGVYYSFANKVDTFSRLSQPGREIEIRYKLSRLEDRSEEF